MGHYGFLQMMVSVGGLAVASSIVGLSLHSCLVQLLRHAAFRRLGRRMKWFVFNPQPKVTLCDDLGAAAPGECVICLEELAGLPAEAAYMPARGIKVPCCTGIGLLRLPCKHTFHASCAHKWMLREVNCPMCRKP